MRIDLFHDTACPWCRIGKRQLQLALDAWQGEPVEVHYRSFLLNPAMPPEGYEFRSYMQAKGGGRVPLEHFFAAPREMGAAVGLRFNFEQIRRAPNTMLSHRLIALAPDDRRSAVVDAVYAAYFEHGQDIGDLQTLVDIAAAAGMDAQLTGRLLEGDTARAQVLADVRWAQEAGISGVPFFIFDGKYALSGARPPAALEEVMRQVADRTVELHAAR